MGGQQSTKESMKYTEVMKNFAFFQKLSHNQLGEVKIFSTNGDKTQLIFEIRRMCQSISQLERLEKHFKGRQALVHQNLTKILYVALEESVMCSSVNQIIVLGEFHQNTLKMEHEQNKNERKLINESRLWYIVYQIISCCAFLEEQGLFHGDIDLQNIYLDQEGTVKLIDFNLNPDTTLNALQKVKLNNEFHYLAPEMLNDLQCNDIQRGIKQDVFSLGICLLELTSHFDCQQLYDWENKKLNMQQLQSVVQFIEQRGYSKVLQNMILQLCQYDINDRPTFILMRDELSSLETQIISHNPNFYRSQIK